MASRSQHQQTIHVRRHLVNRPSNLCIDAVPLAEVGLATHDGGRKSVFFATSAKFAQSVAKILGGTSFYSFEISCPRVADFYRLMM